MARDMQSGFREILTNALQSDGLANALQGSDGAASGKSNSKGAGGLSGMKGLAAGAGAAALAPHAWKNAGKLARSLGVDNFPDAVSSPGEALEGAKSSLGDRLTSSVNDKAKGAIDEAGGPGAMVKDVVKKMLPGGNGGGGKGGAEGVGKARRMPIQQSVDIGIPIETVYNQFTQFEAWPQFMHRVERATQDGECTVSFAVKIWGKTKQFTAEIETQRPDQRIKWEASQGMTHTGVVTFHELGPHLTRIILSFDVDPGGLVEKFARGARHVKRAARADLHRFVAFIEMAEQETGAWRGVIEDGELVEAHDPSYDEQRQYSDVKELTGQDDSDEDEDEDKERDQDERADDKGEGDRGDEQSGDEDEAPTAKRTQRQQGSGGNGRQKRDRGGEAQQRQSGRSRQSSGSGRSGSSSSGRSSSGSSGESRARSRSSRQGKDGGSASSRSSGRSHSSRPSSGGQSRGGSRSQGRKS